jgi:hypothetical protein
MRTSSAVGVGSAKVAKRGGFSKESTTAAFMMGLQ